MTLPTHIAIIPDGNRRWAKQHHLPSFMGHRQGAKAMEDTLDAALKLGVNAVTIMLLLLS
jgi:undecaprenyl diphosphate synthase